MTKEKDKTKVYMCKDCFYIYHSSRVCPSCGGDKRKSIGLYINEKQEICIDERK